MLNTWSDVKTSYKRPEVLKTLKAMSDIRTDKLRFQLVLQLIVLKFMRQNCVNDLKNEFL